MLALDRQHVLEWFAAVGMRISSSKSKAKLPICWLAMNFGDKDEISSQDELRCPSLRDGEGLRSPRRSLESCRRVLS